MSEIIEKKVQFSVEALSPSIPNNRLLTFQSEIQNLQRQVLEIKLSCRNLVMTTFTGEQWENFAFVVSDHPKLAGLMMQIDTVNSEPRRNNLLISIEASGEIPFMGESDHSEK